MQLRITGCTICRNFTGVIDFDEIKEVLNKIGVQERQADPLRIEIAVMLHNRVIAYHAADQKTITTIPQRNFIF